MDHFTTQLNNVVDSYHGFVVAVLTYVKNNKSRLKVVEDFINNNPSAQSSDILEFISKQDDFYNDAAYDNEMNTEVLVSNEEVLCISKKIMEQNQMAYEALSK